MNNSNKDEILKEKLKQALTSTAKVISDDFDLKENLESDKDSKKFNFLDLENLNSKKRFYKSKSRVGLFCFKKKIF